MKETRFLRAMNEIDDAFLLEAEEAKPARHATLRISRRLAALVAALMTILLTVSVSAAYVVIHWDDIFMRRFAPSDAVLQQSENAVQEVSAISQCGDVTVRVSQTLGDTTALYLNLELTLPESIDLYDYAIQDGDAWYSTIWPEDVQLYYRAASYEDLRGKTPEETESWFGESSYPSGMVSVENFEIDPESRTLRYLVGFFDDENQINSRSISLVVGSLTVENGDRMETLLEGPFVVSWKAQNNGAVQHYTLLRDGQPAGRAALSAFGLKVHLSGVSAEDMETLLDLVEIVKKDGSRVKPEGGCCLSYTDPPTEIDMSWQFDEIQVLEDISGIVVGDCLCELQR